MSNFVKNPEVMTDPHETAMQARLLRRMTCHLGEGPIWTGTAWAFLDILNGDLHLLSPDGQDLRTHNLGRFASAAALTDGPELLVATESDLTLIDPATGTQTSLCPLEADNPVTRSNDGRADRRGGFWIGTMGTSAEPEAGALYRYVGGHLRCLRRGLTIPNAICFSPDGGTAYFADSHLGTVYRWRLDDEGWPLGAPEVFFRLPSSAGAPDGAVIDAEGAMWIALWGAGKVQRVLPTGTFDTAIEVAASQPSCPAFGPDGALLITTAREHLSPAELADDPLAGSVFVAQTPVPGIPEPTVRLP